MPHAQAGSAWARWLVPLTLCALTFLLIQTLADRAQPQSLAHRHVLAQEISSPDLFAVEDADWQALELPNPLCRQGCASPHKAYQVRFRWSDGQAVSVYVPLYDSVLQLAVNDELFAASGNNEEDELSDGGYRPVRFEVPVHRLKPGANELTLLLTGFAPGGHALGPIYIGRTKTLQPAFAAGRLLQIDVRIASLGVIAFALVIALVLWRRSGDAAYFWFAVFLGSAALRDGLRLSPDWPTGHDLRMSLYVAGTLGVIAASTLFVRRLCHHSVNTLECTCLVLVGGALLALSAAIVNDRLTGWMLSTTVTQLLALGAAAIQLTTAFRAPRSVLGRFMPIWSSLLLLSLALVFRDVWIHRTTGGLAMPTAHLGLLPLVLAFGILVAERYTASLQALEQQRAALRQEHRRILQELHDGVGGELSAALMQPPDSTTTAAVYRATIEHTLRELRLVSDATNPAISSDLSVALGALRQRIEPLIKASGMVLRWDNQLPAGIDLGRDGVLNVYRILQELVSNAVRHSGAEVLSVSAEVHAATNAPVLTIADDGAGLPEPLEPGVGLASVENRCEEIGAVLEQISSQRGTHWRLGLPTPEVSG